MSSNKNGRSRRNNINWDFSSATEPEVVNATLNSFTNEFEVIQKPATRSKFDFGAHSDHSRSWASDAQQGWGEHSDALNWNAPRGDFSPSTEAQHPDRFSSKETATFRLNMDIEDMPVFDKVIDYTAFREQDIIPDFEDIMKLDFASKEGDDYDDVTDYRQPLPDVPINHTKTPYDSADQYLYTHFELMRQDFLIPLQKAVKSYKQVYASTKGNDDRELAMESVSMSQRPFRLYEHVHLNAIVFGSRQVLYRISFRLPYYIRVNWQQSKRLMPGTLVLLSRDHFVTDLKVATIVEREDEPMRGANRFEYLLDLYLERDNNGQPLGFGDPITLKEDTYVMIEATDGYFEAYRHVLNVFKKTKPKELPFSDYLVKLSNEVLVPDYAARKRIYDINVMDKARNHTRWPVDIMKQWPRYQTRMDKTQMDALKTILSHNLSIVQGPPGTGKTYVGTYAMRVLLSNYDGTLGPIICICQTNHALDQFLEHVLDHTDDIVRVGGRSKSELLKDHTLYELKKMERPRGIGQYYRTRDNISKDIKSTLEAMYEEPCVTIDFIKSLDVLRPRQIQCLERIAEREKNKNTKSATNPVVANLDDSDDDWEISSEIIAAKPTPAPPTSRNKNNNKKRPGSNTANPWAGGNPNKVAEVKPKELNPVEIWLRDAIDYVDDAGVMSSFADQQKEFLLEQEKGLVFDDDPEDRDLIEEDELQEIITTFKDGDDSKGNKSPFIQIGKHYKIQSEPALGERPERKIINYNKIRTADAFDANKFDFFGDQVSDDIFEEDNSNQSVERWMKDDDLSMWPLAVRLMAHKAWVQVRNEQLQRKLKVLMDRYHEISLDIRKAVVLSEAAICKQNRVIGMTSTAAAKYHDLLEKIRPRVMVVEEAAEMLESHIISALTNSLEHLILIGDHQQLRPSTAVHALSENHALGVSLFERLIMNNFPFTRLSHQRRMRPEIRSLINPIYKDPPLQDHPDVASYPTVLGMKHSLFFLAHSEDETHMSESATKINEHEAKMTAKLSVYLLLQGYRAQDITIITMYAGQKSQIVKALREERRPSVDTEPILVSSVDGYQGEENKIIILSLVRSNTMGQIGFLKVANRVCVALSRAKQGLYILGNARLLCERSDLWNEIISNLEDQSEVRIDTKLPLKCSRHQSITEVQWPVDFTEVEEGGCSKPCGEQLACGHKCLLKCHPYSHDGIQCKLQCTKTLNCRHQCMRRCSEHCDPCITKVTVMLPCNHTMEDECGKIRKLALNPRGQRCPVCKAPLSDKK